jgi:hypothetical protein
VTKWHGESVMLLVDTTWNPKSSLCQRQTLKSLFSSTFTGIDYTTEWKTEEK